MNKNIMSSRRIILFSTLLILLFIPVVTTTISFNVTILRGRISHISLSLSDRATILAEDFSGKLYVVLLQQDPFGSQLLDALIAKDINVIHSYMFNWSTAIDADIVLISFSWLDVQDEHTINTIENFIFSGKMIIFFGDDLYNIYSKINPEVIQENFAVFPAIIQDDGSINMFVPDNLVAMSITTLSTNEEEIEDNTQTRLPTIQFYLLGELTTDYLIFAIFDWYDKLLNTKEEYMNFINAKNDGESKNIHKNNIIPKKWDGFVGALGWYSKSFLDDDINFGLTQLYVKYWYKRSESRPNQWRYFLVHSEHRISPLTPYVAPYKTITQVDCDTDNKPGQILDNWNPSNWGRLQKEIEFSVSAPEGGATSLVTYSFDASTLSWGDLSSPGLGIHKVQHTFYTWWCMPYGLTATVEPTSIFMEDETKLGGSEPLELSHYALSQIYVKLGQSSVSLSNSISFAVLVYSIELTS